MTDLLSSGESQLDSSNEESISPTEMAFLRQIARSESHMDADEPLHPPEGGDWAGPRFTIGRRLGVGGFGAVYEAFDHQRQARVALKTVMRKDGNARYRFKREFRALADLVHPNLVELYELHGDDARWFFTMELVRGVDLQSWLSAADEAGIRAALRQLAEGLCFLHERGRLHRDIKPPNVMVDGEGRVVLLDFGLVVDLADTAKVAAAGTPRYMPPEIFSGPIGPALDWYAVGVLLYEVLAGQPPFDATLAELIRIKSTSDPPPLDQLAPDAPSDLRQLCHELLQRDPAARPNGREILERLAGRTSDLAGLRDINVAASVFVGRTAELEQLHAVFASSRTRNAVALVHAAPGMGKSAVVSHWLAELRATTPDTIVLAGRCFEQESVPYQALDSLIDDLGRYLKRLPPEVVQTLVLRDVGPLLTLFPSLGQVLHCPPDAAVVFDKAEARRRAVLALGGLLGGLAARAPLVLWIDDLHWGDRDGGSLLADLFSRPDAPALLLILSYRSDEAERSSCLQVVLPALRAETAIELKPLAEEESRRLVASVLDTDRADALARESGGSPLLVRELCHYLRDMSMSVAMPVSTVEAMVAARVAALPDDARGLLEVVALAGQRIERGVVGIASRIGDREPATIGLLRRGSFVRTSSGRIGEEIEAAHDRIREVVVAGLAPDIRTGHHRGLARALAATGRAEPEVLASHFEGAGERSVAAGYWEQAAQQAFDALAFDRAARLYRQAIATHTTVTFEPENVCHLRVRLAESLGYSGRGAEAAASYIEASTDAEPVAAMELRRLALEQYLWSGYVDEGFGVLRSVLATTGLAMPRTQIGTALRIAGHVLLLRLRGVRRRPRAAADTPFEVVRLDVAAAASLCLGSLDPLRGFYFHFCELELALRSHDSFRLLRSLGMDLGFRAAIRGARPPTHIDREIEQLLHAVYTELSPTDPRRAGIDGLIAGVAGVRKLFGGEFIAARRELEYAEARLVECPVKIGNTLALVRIWLSHTLYIVGAWRRLTDHVAAGLVEARERGDRLTEFELQEMAAFLEVIADRPEDAAAGMARLAEDAPSSRGKLDITFGAWVALYRDTGIGDEARRIFETHWTALHALLIRLSPLMGAATLFLRGAVHLASAAVSEHDRPLKIAERTAHKVARVPSAYASPFSMALLAGVAAHRGERDRAEALLVEAEAGFARLGMETYVAAVQRRRGQLMGDVGGEQLIAQADQALAHEGVRNPERFVAMSLPGRW